MPEPTFLQIQGRGDSVDADDRAAARARSGSAEAPIARSGSATPGLGDVQCMLRRRGTTWHFQPVGPSGHVWIDGRAADQQRPIPLGVPFRVGDHWLTLRPADSATNDWGTFDAPISVEVEIEAQSEPKRRRPTSRPASTDSSRCRRLVGRRRGAAPSLASPARTARALAQGPPGGAPLGGPLEVGRRDDPLEDHSPRRQAILAPSNADANANALADTPAGLESECAEEAFADPAGRQDHRAEGAEPIRRAADPTTPRPSAPRVVVRPLTDPPAPIRRPVAPSPKRVEARPLAGPETPQASTSRALVALAPAPRPAVVEPEVIPEPAPIEVDRLEIATVEEVATAESAEEVATAESSSALPLGEGPGVRDIASPERSEEGSLVDHSTGYDPLPEGERRKKAGRASPSPRA